MSDFRRNRAGRHRAWRTSLFTGTVICLTAALGACGGGDDAASAGGGAPTISGTPPNQALQGQQYSFTPTASDPNGDSLTFTITGTPPWATFNATTGTSANPGRPRSQAVANRLASAVLLA